MTPLTDQTLHQFLNLSWNWTLLPILTLLPTGGFHRTLQRVRLANRGRLLLRTPGPDRFRTCICSNVEIIISWTCHIYGSFEFRTSLVTSILPCNKKLVNCQKRTDDLFQHFVKGQNIYFQKVQAPLQNQMVETLHISNILNWIC